MSIHIETNDAIMKSNTIDVVDPRKTYDYYTFFSFRTQQKGGMKQSSNP